MSKLGLLKISDFVSGEGEKFIVIKSPSSGRQISAGIFPDWMIVGGKLIVEIEREEGEDFLVSVPQFLRYQGFSFFSKYGFTLGSKIWVPKELVSFEEGG